MFQPFILSYAQAGLYDGMNLSLNLGVVRELKQERASDARGASYVAAHWTVYKRLILHGALLQNIKNEWNKWKNQMKGDVGMSSHKKEREQEDAYTKTESHL